MFHVKQIRMFNNYNSLIMNNKTLMDNLRCVPDFPRKGINFRDVTTLYKNAECMKIMLDEMERRKHYVVDLGYNSFHR